MLTYIFFNNCCQKFDFFVSFLQLLLLLCLRNSIICFFLQKLDELKVQSPHLVSHLADGPHREDQCAFGATIPTDRIQNLDNISTLDYSSVHDFSNTMVLHKTLIHNYENLKMPSLEERNPDNCKSNGMLDILASGQAATDNSGFSQLSSPSTTSFSPNRYLTCQHCSLKIGGSTSYSFFTPFSHS